LKGRGVVGLPAGVCIGCLKGSSVKDDPEFVYGDCAWCGKVTDCVRGDYVELFVPYIPLQRPLDIVCPEGKGL
jgi:hypothetical protein